MRNDAPTKPAPCPYCAAPVEADRETCASCGKTLPPLPHLTPAQQATKWRNAIHLTTGGIAYVAIGLTLAQIGIAKQYPQMFNATPLPTVSLLTTISILVATGYVSWQHKPIKPAENSPPRLKIVRLAKRPRRNRTPRSRAATPQSPASAPLPPNGTPVPCANRQTLPRHQSLRPSPRSRRLSRTDSA